MVLKPPEHTPAFSALLAELLPKYLDPELYQVINGAVPETTKVSSSVCVIGSREADDLGRSSSYSGTIVRAIFLTCVPALTSPTYSVMYTGMFAPSMKVCRLTSNVRLGNGRVARIVAQAASKYLTPLTLEVSSA